MGVTAEGILRGYQGLFTPVSLGYPLSLFNKNSTLKHTVQELYLSFINNLIELCLPRNVQFDDSACNCTATCWNAFSSGAYRQENSIIYSCLTNPCHKLPNTRVMTLKRIPRYEFHELCNISFSTAASAIQKRKKRVIPHTGMSYVRIKVSIDGLASRCYRVLQRRQATRCGNGL